MAGVNRESDLLLVNRGGVDYQTTVAKTFGVVSDLTELPEFFDHKQLWTGWCSNFQYKDQTDPDQYWIYFRSDDETSEDDLQGIRELKKDQEIYIELGTSLSKNVYCGADAEDSSVGSVPAVRIKINEPPMLDTKGRFNEGIWLNNALGEMKCKLYNYHPITKPGLKVVSVREDDSLLVNRGGTNYKVNREDARPPVCKRPELGTTADPAVKEDDLFLINQSNVDYCVTKAELIPSVCGLKELT